MRQNGCSDATKRVGCCDKTGALMRQNGCSVESCDITGADRQSNKSFPVTSRVSAVNASGGITHRAPRRACIATYGVQLETRHESAACRNVAVMSLTLEQRTNIDGVPKAAE